MDSKSDNSNKYGDIINLPHPVSKTHPHMSMINRAAQFSPFAALPGYGAAIKETARITDKKLELDEGEKAIINEKLIMVAEAIKNRPVISVTYFQSDNKKSDGEYITVTGSVKKIDIYECFIKMTEGTVISFDDIFNIEI